MDMDMRLRRTRFGKRKLAGGASFMAVVIGLAVGPAHAQQVVPVRSIRSAMPTPVGNPQSSVTLVRSPRMSEALSRQAEHLTRADEIRSYVTAARDAAIAASRTKPSEGLSANGLDPVTAIRQAVALSQAGGGANTAKANQLLIGASSANDVTGVATWEGASLPSQTVADGKYTVSITQTQSRALLSWNKFDVGANTTLKFDQKIGGVAQTGWTVVNRVVESIAPSTILGSIKADGTVLVLNQRGVIFGAGAQVNLHSLVASTLDLGNFGTNYRDALFQGSQQRVFDALTIKQRNTNYLENGLFALPSADPLTLPPFLLSPLYAPGTYAVAAAPPAIEGDVTVDAGAAISSNAGGFIILAAPKVVSSGALSAVDGQVSLQGGRFISAIESTGRANSVDPDVRGIVLRSAQPGRSNAGLAAAQTAQDGVVINRGVIDSTRGYISLGAGLYGSVTNGGLLAATTSVSRNGKIGLYAGNVTLSGSGTASHAGGILILPDRNGETIPQGTAIEPPSFKSSQIEIGALADAALQTDAAGRLVPGTVAFGQNSLILAPSADVVIGRAAIDPFDLNVRIDSFIDIKAGAVIDVSGVRNVQLAATRNSLAVTPVKRNELRDTPNYREVAIGDDFTLNGTTLYVDPRLSGVRSDGVAWIGSPLIEAGSLASQIPVTAAELMTSGGNISMGVGMVTAAGDAAAAPYISIAKGAEIDISGGWVNYAAGIVRTSKLITADGRVVDISEADPNDEFVAVAEGFSQTQPRFGVIDTFNNVVVEGRDFQISYDEGRDAGSLSISASAIRADGIIRGDAFAGTRQILGGVRPSLASAIVQDPRKLQANFSQLPSGGFLRIGSFSGARQVDLGGDIAIYHGAVGSTPSPLSSIRLSDAVINASGLSALTLQTTGGITLAATADLILVPGATVTLDAGRSIRLDGDISVPSGRIAARTYEFGAIGSPFRSDDDVASVYAVGSALPSPYDIVVGGTLSAAGRWVNDYRTDDTLLGGSGWIDGGSISLTVAPRALVALGTSLAEAEIAGDLSGSILIAPNALLDVSAGGYVAPDRSFTLSARGGNISLINQTSYASLVPTVRSDFLVNSPGNSLTPVNGTSQTVDFTPLPVEGSLDPVLPQLVPTSPVARVSFAQSSLRGFGFASGGTFTLVSPDISFGSDHRAGSSHIGLDFFAVTGFGTLDMASFRSRIVPDIFSNARAGNSAFLDTTTVRIRAGETLNLSQSLLPTYLSLSQVSDLVSLGTGESLFSVLTPSEPTEAFDRRGANLTLGGLMELDVNAGGSIVGAQARISVPKLLNAGRIRLPGGIIEQKAVLPSFVAGGLLGINGATGLSQVFGPADENGQYDEDAANAAGIVDPSDPDVVLSNRELLTTPGAERFIVFNGALGTGEGIRLAAGSVTDLSGLVVHDPRAPFQSGTQLRTGRLIAGGRISTAAANGTDGSGSLTLYDAPIYDQALFRLADTRTGSPLPIAAEIAARSFVAARGATLDLSGASGVFDVLATPTSYVAQQQWTNGGTLSVLGGGSFAGATVRAQGGAPQAIGGTIEWLRPTLAQRPAGQPASDTIFASEIESAGFDSFVARGSVTFAGNVALHLDRGFSLLSAPALTADQLGADAGIRVSALEGANGRIFAPYIRFASRIGAVGAVDGESGVAESSVRFIAGTSGIDFFGATLFDGSIGSTMLESAGDVRFIGVNDVPASSTALPKLDGEIVAQGNLGFDASRVYATTGTGNLQRIVEDVRAGRKISALPFQLTALGENSAISFGGSHPTVTTPLSAGSYLRVQAANIVQNGYLAAPLGYLEIGSDGTPSILGQLIRESDLPGLRTVQAQSISFGAGSTTSVSGSGASIPYGTTIDLTDYFFAPTTGLPLTTTPVGQLRLAGDTIDIGAGAKIDGRGGGDIFAFEFVSGVGGSRDVLDRFNQDRFSSNDYDPVTGTGFQFADHRQVYAIVPADQARTIAMYDPIYSADYGANGPADLYGANAGLSITLDGTTGIPAGEYLLMPAHYALLPGAFRVVENTDLPAPVIGVTQTLRDGSLVVGGTYSIAGSDFADSTRRSFTIQSRSTFLKYSRIETTSGSTAVKDQADRAGTIAPRLPLDAARVVLALLSSLKVAGLFEVAAAAGGKGAQFDIVATNIIVAPDGAEDTPGTLTLTNSTIANLNANSLVIGAERRDNEDGTTTLGVIANQIDVTTGTSIKVPELVFAVGGGPAYENELISPQLSIGNGVSLIATGTLSDDRDGDYVVAAPASSALYDQTGIGSVVRLANGPERLIRRTGTAAQTNTGRPTRLLIGNATLQGTNLAFETSRLFRISNAATIDADHIALTSDTIRFGTGFIDSTIEAKFASADRLTLRSSDPIIFSGGTHAFNDLDIDSRGITIIGGESTDVRITADRFGWSNSGAAYGGCTDFGNTGCGFDQNKLMIAADEIRFGSGKVGTYAFDGRVTLEAANGIYVEGAGSLDTGDVTLNLVTPFIADRAIVANPLDQKVRPDFDFLSSTAVALRAQPVAAGATAPAPTGNRAPGARIGIGSADAPAGNVTIDGTSILATAGIIDINAQRNITLTGAMTLATPGYAKTFGDAVDSVTVSAGGGTINLVARTGNIVLPSTSTLIVDSFDGPDAKGRLDRNDGQAGTINLIASRGMIDLRAKLNPGIKGLRDASLTFDAGKSSFDLGGFLASYGSAFRGDLNIRAGLGDLTLAQGRILRATSVRLTADGGTVQIGGTIDTSGVSVAGMKLEDAKTARVNGGAIGLFGEHGVTLGATALLDTHTTGYADADSRVAKAGDVTIGIGSTDAALTIASGARIDVGARRTQAAQAKGNSGNRLIAQTVKDPFTLSDTTVYRFAEADAGGVVTYRAPVVDNLVDIRLPGANPVIGASSVQIEGFYRYDLDHLAELAELGEITGVRSALSFDGVSTFTYLEFADGLQTATGLDPDFPTNILAADFVTADGTPSVVNFIRNFAISAADGRSLDGIRLRPGVEFTSRDTIDIVTNWNLGAGEVDQASALADGVLVPITQLLSGVRFEGDPYVSVAPGREAELLENYTNMYYRVGGRIDGEAPIVTMRSQGSVRVEGSISDGFFTFRDRTDPFYMSYQLGGGDRQVLPATTFTCATIESGDCSGTFDFLTIASGGAEYDPFAAARINLAQIVAGADTTTSIPAPFSARANSPGGLGAFNENGEETGDPFGTAALFPLIHDGADSVKSSSLRIVAGADTRLSADPLHVDRAQAADVVVTGERSYQVASPRGVAQYVTTGGFDPNTGEYLGDYNLQIRITPNVGTSDVTYGYVNAGRGLIDYAATNSDISLDPATGTEIYTVLNWGGGDGALQAYVREKADAYFRFIDPASYDFSNYENLSTARRDALRLGIVQGGAARTGVAARLNDVLGFLATIGPEFAQQVIDGSFTVPAPVSERPITYARAGTAYYGTVVRTGDGTIDLAASRDVTLLRSAEVTYRNGINLPGTPDESRQVGGTAVYTAGHLLARAPVTAATANGLTRVTLSWSDAPLFAASLADSDYIPSPKGQFFETPALLSGGGAISIAAGGDVIGRHDAWAEAFLTTGTDFTRPSLGRFGNSFPVQFNSFDRINESNSSLLNQIGSNDQLWRTGTIGQNTLIAEVPRYFTAGVGTLGGGDVSIIAGDRVQDLTVALNTSAITANPVIGTSPLSAADSRTRVDTAPILASFNRGDLSIVTGSDLIGGRFDIASGAGTIDVGGDVGNAPPIDRPRTLPNAVQLRVSDATVALVAKGAVALSTVSALGASGSNQTDGRYASAGNFTAIATADISASGPITLRGDIATQAIAFDNAGAIAPGFVLPPAFLATSLTGDIALTDTQNGLTDATYLLYPSLVGQLSLLSGGTIDSISVAMSDADPSFLAGQFSVFRGSVQLGGGANVQQGLAFGFPAVLPTSSEADLRLQHNERITHLGDATPARIYADGSILNSTISLAKQARIGAGVDIIDMFFVGQNVTASDVTRITAGRDIIASTGLSSAQLPYFISNSLTLGGPGSFYVQAGRNLGPFITSATIEGVDFAGGIRTVGNDYNPWLKPAGADIFAFFGVANGANYDGLRETYLNPANFAMLDGDLFAQIVDVNGNASPDRTRPVYAPKLATWLRDNEPGLFAGIFGTTSYPDTDAGAAALAQAAYGKTEQLYAAFATLGGLRQQQFLIKQLYFNELSQPSFPDSPSFQQFIRGYRAVQTLFPATLGYTDNLAAYTADPSTVNEDHPLGAPTRALVDGQPVQATQVVTGNVDLRLSTIQTTRGGDITILGPGGDFIAGSVVRTSDQPNRRATAAGDHERGGVAIDGRLTGRAFTAVPLGFEGILTLRGGAINSFTDGDFRLNQSRLFTQSGGDIRMWSSNGDLNAGQGPKSASNFPPVVVRFDANGASEVDTAGSVSGAGIGAFRQSPTDPASSVILIAPVGEVDAGDAGVRASGNVFVAAARVANADNFKAEGNVSGVPSGGVSAGPAVPADATSATVAQATKGNDALGNADKRSIITVDVLGAVDGGAGDKCKDPENRDPECR